MKLAKLLFTTFPIIAIVAGCVSIDTKQMAKEMYNVPETGKSEFDGTSYVRMKNIACSGDTIIRLDLYQDSKMALEKQALLKLKVTGVHSIGNGESLHFNIDGEKISLSTLDAITEMEEVYASQYAPGYVGGGTYVSSVYFPATRASTKRYPISEILIQKIANAKKVVVKAELSTTYVEGICSPLESEEWNKDNEWFKELSGTYGFKNFIELMKTRNTQ